MSANDFRERDLMHLRVLLPTEVLVDEKVTKVIAEADNGQFCLLPRHVDFVAAIVPSVLYFHTEDDESYVAVDHGVLVKCAHDVFVSTFNGVVGTDMERLQMLVEEHFLEIDEHERKTRSALARLEAGTLRGFRELQEKRRG